ncbi:MAG: GMC family oxidoreductase N-terminal domain-containing protein [Candidatus Krumholzibacteria bacterium]|nr:GMC family oxidoreductase N-terminal domain-containing protein [Candidatus Krumholzibacteria bacterium]
MRRRLRKSAATSVARVTEGLYKLPASRRQALAELDQQRSAQDGKWFTARESEIVEAIASLVVPTEDDIPGAAELSVLGPTAAATIGGWVAVSPQKQRLYTRGLLSFDEIARRRFGAGFAALPSEKRGQLFKDVEAMYQATLQSRSAAGKVTRKLGRFVGAFNGSVPAADLFPVVLRDTREAFYTSEVSWLWLGYDGPPMPHGYENLLEPRPRLKSNQAPSLRETVDSLASRPVPPVAHPLLKQRGEVDVVIIGSGAGGAVVAKELAEAGLAVVVIEAGPRFNPYVDYISDRTDFEQFAKFAFKKQKQRDVYTVGSAREFTYTRVKGVGGSTLKYAAMSPRLHESDFRTHSEDGVGADWPITYADLEPYYARVEYELGVSGPGGEEANPFDPPRSTPFPNPPHPFNLASHAIKRGAQSLGLHLVREPVSIPSREWKGRPACVGAGTCHIGCSIAAKSSMDVTYIAAAEATGNIEIRTECTAFQILMGTDGRARGVLYFDPEGREQEVLARAVVLAANAVETPRLLFMSANGRFPEGLANSSGLLGKNFFEHIAIFAHGRFEERLDPWRGTPTGGMIQDNYATRSSNGFARGWTTIVTANSHWPLGMARRIPGWGAAHKNRVRELFGHSVCVASIGEQLPDERNRIMLDPTVKDSFGLPAPRLVNELYDNDRAMEKAIRRDLTDVLEASGAKEIWKVDYMPGQSSHYLGTCRMGNDPQTSVVDAWGRTHDVRNLFISDGSVFVTGGSVNPALTISALAARTAEGLIRAFKEGTL